MSTKYPYNSVLFVSSDFVDDVNRIALMMGWQTDLVKNTFHIGCSPSGNEPFTDYVTRTDTSETFQYLLAFGDKLIHSAEALDAAGLTQERYVAAVNAIRQHLPVTPDPLPVTPDSVPDGYVAPTAREHFNAALVSEGLVSEGLVIP